MIYSIPEINEEAFLKKMTQVERKFAKYGLSICVVKCEEYFDTTEIDGSEELVKYIKYEIAGANFLQISGYTIVAEIEACEFGTGIVRYRSNILLPENFDTSNFHCDHCNSNRNRKKIYVLQDTDTGEFIRVGSTCMKEFTGISADIVASYYTTFEEMFEFTSIRETVPKYYLVKEVLIIANQVVKYLGYVSKYDAYIESALSTSEIVTDVLDYILGRKQSERCINNATYHINKYHIDVKSRSDSDAIDNYIEIISDSVIANEDLSEYMTKVYGSISGKYCTVRDIGLLCSSIKFANQIKLRKQKEAELSSRPVSNYVGEIGEKLNFLGDVKFITTVDSMYGISRLYEISDESGNVFKWFYSGYNQIGDGKYNIIGTVKNHSIYNGIKETQLVRCKLAEV